MLNITTCHLNKCPNGRFTFVGRVPAALTKTVPANKSDAMGGRAWMDDNNKLWTLKVLVFDTEAEAREAAATANVKLAD